MKDGEVLISLQFFSTLLSMVNLSNITEFLNPSHVHFPYPTNTNDELQHLVHCKTESAGFTPFSENVQSNGTSTSSIQTSQGANLADSLRMNASIPAGIPSFIPPPVDMIPPQLPTQLISQPSIVTTPPRPIVIPFDSVKSHGIIRQLGVVPTVVKTEKLGMSFLSRLFPDGPMQLSQ